MKLFNKKKLSPDFPAPNDEEIKKTQRTIMVQYNVELSDKNASIFVNLVKELNWWVGLKDDQASKAKIIDELIAECKEIYRKKYDKEITDLEAANCAETLLGESSEEEIERIKDKMTSMISSDNK